MPHKYIVKLSWKRDDTLNFESQPERDKQGPKELLLNALGLCTGMTLIAILKKMRLEINECTIEVLATLADENPTPQSTFSHFLQTVRLNTPHKDSDSKYSHALAITHTRYCAVTTMVRRIAPVDLALFINGKEVRIEENR